MNTAAGARGAGRSPLHVSRGPSAATAVLAAGAVTLAACSGSNRPEPAEVVLSIGYAGPAEAGVATGLDQLIGRLTREGLVLTGPDGRVEPILAKSWSVDAGKTIVLTLRKDVVFHDGSPMTAEDVKASLDRSRANPRTVTANPMIGDIESVEATDPHRIVINLARPSAQLVMFNLSVGVEKQGPNDEPVGTGPFFVESTSADETTLRANPHYRTRSEIDAVRIRTYPTLRTAWAAMMRSEIDFLFNVPIEARDFVEADPNVRVFSSDTPYAYALVFNTRRPPFDDPRVRVALSRAVDREAIIDSTFQGHSSVASGLWTSHWVYNGVELTYDYEPRVALRQLRAISQPRAVSADRRPTGLPTLLEFEVLVGTDLARIEPMALMMQRQLRQIGVDMAIDAKPFGAVAQQIRGDTWDAVLLPVNTARNLSRLYVYWHSSQQSAVSGFTGVDDTLESLRSSETEAETSALASELQRILFEEAPAVFLAGLEEARAVSRRFDVPDEPGRDIVETLWQWRVAEQTSQD